MRCFSARSRFAGSCPSTVDVAGASAVRYPSRISVVVVLPAPFGPRSAKTSPRSTWTIDPPTGFDVAVGLAQAVHLDRRGRPPDRPYPTPKPASRVDPVARAARRATNRPRLSRNTSTTAPSHPSKSPEMCGETITVGHRPQGRDRRAGALPRRRRARRRRSRRRQRVDERRLVHRRPATDVEEARGRLHRGEGRRVEDRGASPRSAAAHRARRRPRRAPRGGRRAPRSRRTPRRSARRAPDRLDGHPEVPRAERRGAGRSARADHHQVASRRAGRSRDRRPNGRSPGRRSTRQACRRLPPSPRSPIRRSGRRTRPARS